MRKIASYIMIIMMLTFIGAKPVDALVLDPAALSAKISDWVGKVQDATSKITQQISQTKQTFLQGFSKLKVFEKGKSYLEKYKNKLTKKSKKDKAVIEDTKNKEKGQLEDEQKLYKETKQKYYEVQQNLLDDNMTEMKTNLKQTQAELKAAESSLKNKEYIYKTLQSSSDDAEKISQAQSEYNAALAKVEELKLKQTDLENNIKNLEQKKEVLSKEASKVGTNDDPEYKAYQDRIKALEASEDVKVEIATNDVSKKEWDSDGLMEEFTISEENYQNFLKKYFYSEFNIAGTVDRQSSQAEMDKILRNRRHLVVNSAVHLLQVTATIRRELPERSNLIKEMYDDVRSTESEFEAIGYYSGTKIENIRALLLYAKLQSAKLQYMAAKDLLIIEPRRRGDASEDKYEFNLSKYKLTDKYIKAIEDEAKSNVNPFEESK